MTPERKSECAERDAREMRSLVQECKADYLKVLERAEQAEAERDALKAENGELKETLAAFRHVHAASEDGDACARCGLDLRDPIHTRGSGR